MARTQITLKPEVEKRAKKRAKELGLSLSAYLGSLLIRELESTPEANVSAVFDLGSSGEPSNIAKDKRRMLVEAFSASRPKSHRG
jgi:hypothetical protein